MPSAPGSDPYNLRRFIEGTGSGIDRVLAELRAGRKRSHWMWFVFPQIAGLGFSPMAQRYAISGRDEAVAYLSTPGARGASCAIVSRLVLETRDGTIDDIFGSPDNLKFRSSMTLFAHVADDNEVFVDALARYFPDGEDPATLDRLK